jgi:hypothetical protein
MTMVTEKVIYPGNDYIIERALTQRDTATGEDEPAVGLAGVVGFISATKGGAPIDASLQVTLTERSGVPGQYFGPLEGSVLTTHLTAGYDEQTVWECVQSGTDYKEYVAIRVRSTRIGG